MAFLLDLSEFISALPPHLSERLVDLITILKAVGIAFIIYVVYLIIKAILGFKMSRRIKRIEEEINLLNYKIDKIFLSTKKSSKSKKHKE